MTEIDDTSRGHDRRTGVGAAGHARRTSCADAISSAHSLDTSRSHTQPETTAPVWSPSSSRRLGIDLSPWLAMMAGAATEANASALRRGRYLRAANKERRDYFGTALGGHMKRALDIVVAGSALVLLSPVMATVALLVHRSIGSPVIFAHDRVGFGGRTFQCLKFRTMVVDGDAILQAHLSADPDAMREWTETRKLRNDPRVTKLGHILRKTSLDELPQLWNVLRGDMSCVGPRPIVPAELENYRLHARHYLRARPGLTGIWQVSGRSSTSYRQRIVMDTHYARNWSLWLDLQLLARTPPAVVKTNDAV